MCNKAVQTTIDKLKKQIKKIKETNKSNEVTKLNSMILGSHNYYKCATHITKDFAHIDFLIRKNLEIQLREIITDKPRYSKIYKRLYGTYNGKVRTIRNIVIFPIYGCKTKPPKCFTQDICNYTKIGRTIIHKNLKNETVLITKYLEIGNKYKSTELFDNSISLIAGQQGRCHISKQKLEINNMECHHKKPKSLGGSDDYNNLVWLCSESHKLVHSTTKDTINKYLGILDLDEKGLKRLNTLRKLVGNSVI